MKIPLPAAIFEWPSRHNVHVALPLLLVVSFILHAACVMVFQVTYPRTRSVPPREARVYFLKPGSPQEAAVEPMLTASDPALFSPAQMPIRHSWAPPEVSYQASFDAQRPTLAALPAATPSPVANTILSLDRPMPRAVGATSPSPGMPTRVELGGGLAGRVMKAPEGARFTAVPKSGTEPLEFLVEVSAEGRVMHAFLQSQPFSSGNESLEGAARAYLYGAQFDPQPGGAAVWGTARFLWGADVRAGGAP